MFSYRLHIKENNYCTGISLTQAVIENMETIDFCTLFTVTSQQWSLRKENCDF